MNKPYTKPVVNMLDLAIIANMIADALREIAKHGSRKLSAGAIALALYEHFTRCEKMLPGVAEVITSVDGGATLQASATYADLVIIRTDDTGATTYYANRSGTDVRTVINMRLRVEMRRAEETFPETVHERFGDWNV